MKKFLAVAAVLAVSSVNAQDVKFGDLNYFIKQSQVNLSSDFSLNREETRFNDEANEIEGYVSSTKLAFGLMDNLNVFLGLNYLYDMERHFPAGSNSSIDGLQNPILGANFRLMNQANSGFNLDLGATVDYNLMDYEVAAQSKENGNTVSRAFSHYGDPRNSLELNARLGKKWNEANEFYVVSALTYNMDGETEDKVVGDDVEFDSSIDLALGAFYQYRPVNEFMMTLGLSATRNGEVEGETMGDDFTSDDHIDYTFSFAAKYLITESFIAKFNFSQDKRSDYDVEFDAGGTNKYERRTGNQFGLGVDFLF